MAHPSLTPADRKHREEFAAFSIKHGHEAYRAILESLYTLWEGWNRDYFAGKLVKPHILLAEPKSPRALGDHLNISGWGSKNQIRVRPSFSTVHTRRSKRERSTPRAGSCLWPMCSFTRRFTSTTTKSPA